MRFFPRERALAQDRPPPHPASVTSFQLGRAALEMQLSSADWGLLEDRGVHLLVKGSVLSHAPREMLDLYRRHGPGFARELSGSFLLVLVDEALGEALVVTDQSGSLKAYSASQDGAIWISSSVQLLMSQPSLAGRALDPAGVASSLLTGQTFDRVTLFQGVRRLERASVHRLSTHPTGPVGDTWGDSGLALDSREYWTADYQPRPALNLAGGQAELGALLIRTLENHWRAAGSAPALSLSAGCDARAILGLLGEVLGVQNLTTFSYALGKPEEGSDPALSPRLAARYGFKHELIPSYRGDLLQTLHRNALWGDGGANFCDEVDAWDTLSRAGLSDVFVGDHAFGWNDRLPPGDPGYLAEQAGLLEWRALGWAQPLLAPEVWSGLERGWGRVRAGVLSRLPPGAPQDQMDGLYLDQRIQHGLMPWREHFTSRAGQVRNVFLDGAVLEFMRRTPAGMRDDKRLFARTVRALAPDLFALPFARKLGYKPDWAQELFARRGDLAEELSASSSPLDALVPPETLLRLLGELQPQQGTSGVGGLAAPIKTRLAQVRRSGPVSRLLGPLPTRTQVPVSAFLMRALTLRTFLATLP